MNRAICKRSLELATKRPTKNVESLNTARDIANSARRSNLRDNTENTWHTHGRLPAQIIQRNRVWERIPKPEVKDRSMPTSEVRQHGPPLRREDTWEFEVHRTPVLNWKLGLPIHLS